MATTSTGRGRSATVRAVEEAAVVGQADVGQQVAVPGRLVGQHARQVGAGHQAGDAGVAAEELVGDRDRRGRRRGRATATSGADHLRAELAGQDADRRVAARPQRHRRGRERRGAQPGVRGRVRRQDPPPARRRRRRTRAAAPVGRRRPAAELELERAGHADAVLVHREALVVLGGRERPAGHQVVLVGGVDHAAGRAPRVKTSCQSSTASTTAAASAGVCGRIAGLGVEPRDAERHDGDRRQLRVLVEDRRRACRRATAPSLTPGTDDDLAAHLDAVVEQRPQPAQARRAARVAQHPRPQRRGRWRGCSRAAATAAR